MPYASPSRYQSRLFNFVNQQSRRLGDRLQKSFRYFQVATSWSLEALFYPVYLLFQKAIDSATRQISSQEQPAKQRLEADPSDSTIQALPTGDIPIRQVLHTVENLQQEAIVQGIASELVSRNLVLISTDNQILNILTQEHQKEIQDKIITEIAKYWREWRLIAEKNETRLLTEIDRLLTKLSSGHQKKIPALQSKITAYDQLSPKPYPILASLDAAVAKVESNALVPVQKQASALYQTILNRLSIFVYQKEQLSALEQEQENHGLNIQALIWEAINFFFGAYFRNRVEADSNSYTNPVSGAIPSENSIFQSEIAPSPSTRRIAQKFNSGSLTKKNLKSQQIERSESESFWLSQSDLFSESGLINNRENNELALSTEAKKQGNFHKLRLYFSAATSLINHSQKRSNKGKIFHQVSHKTQIEAQPDWIEAKAKVIGYEKHPLEQILLWLDRIMLFLEEMLFKILQFLQKLWLRK